MTRVVAASVHPVGAAGTRLRLAPVMRALDGRNISATLATFLQDDDLADWLKGGRPRYGAARRGAGRVPGMIGKLTHANLLLLHREALPVNDLALERLARRRDIPIVWDVDDSLWASPGGRARSLIRGSEAKYRWLARESAEVWAGNRHVARWAAQAGAREVVLVPTTVDVPESVSNHDREDDLLAWIGTPSTGPFIEALLHELADSLDGWRVLVVGAGIQAPDGVQVTQQPWSAEAEVAALRRASVGLYPLDVDHPTTSGKSALKSILFMANAIPVIATPTQSNRDVMADGVQGLFAESKDQWLAALSALREPGTRRRMGAAGHTQAREKFDSSVWAQLLADRICHLLAGHGGDRPATLPSDNG